MSYDSFISKVTYNGDYYLKNSILLIDKITYYSKSSSKLLIDTLTFNGNFTMQNSVLGINNYESSNVNIGGMLKNI